MRTVSIHSFNDVADIITEFHTKNWLFRGVDNESYALRPKIGRVGARIDPETGNALPYNQVEERTLLNRFKLEARPLLAYQPSNDLEWLVVAQHHGLPTR